ncbi:MAG: hypothetical protein ACTHLW_18575 [Verrucomicrobiota bacterium]
MIMMRGATTFVCFLGVSLSLSARAASADSGNNGRYQTIMERNVFGLKSAPPPQAETPAPPPPLKVILTGITTLLGNKRALLTAQIPSKPAENLMLTEGQRDGEIEVIEINEQAGSVKILNHGVEQTLDFKTDGAKPQVTLTPTSNPVPGVPPTNTAQPGVHMIPTRSMRLPPLPGGGPQP